MKKNLTIVAPAGVSADVWKFLLSDYLRPARPSFAACYRRAEMFASHRGETLPSLSTLMRKMREAVASPLIRARGDRSLAYRLVVTAAPSAPVDVRATERGFSRGEFKDLYGEDCSIQDSSLATADAIWLGVNENRMHLSREQVSALLPLLETFVATGSIGTPA